MKTSVVTLVFAASLLTGSLPVSAQDAETTVVSPGVINIVSEVRVGGGYHMVYFTMLPIEMGNWYWTRPEDLTADVLFTSPDLDLFRWIGSPRPEIGATINLQNEDDLFHAGLTWQLPIFDTPLYLEGTFGAAAVTGFTTGAPAGRRNYGCQVNFYERFGVGTHIGDHATATLTYEHTSNAGLCPANAGLSNLGLRLGWKF